MHYSPLVQDFAFYSFSDLHSIVVENIQWKIAGHKQATSFNVHDVLNSVKESHTFPFLASLSGIALCVVCSVHLLVIW